MRLVEAEAQLRRMGVGNWHYSIGAEAQWKFCVLEVDGRWTNYFVIGNRKEEYRSYSSEEDAARYLLKRFKLQRKAYDRFGLDLDYLARDEQPPQDPEESACGIIADIRYYVIVKDAIVSERMIPILRRYFRDGFLCEEAYKFPRGQDPGWDGTNYFFYERYGEHEELERIAVSKEDAERAVQEALQRAEGRRG
ncbi:hypothetical protein [Glycomyces buryatensis]|uniref:Uncharacterized protein n=1 Tax=Glycomyces buryatensis TaxID=2570927 RepID=A0A4S8QQF9_9ACTN|nr:hypothetical protein [Glycomyces buryatensis]THV42954.1 hypothetical protein FAB82_04195 [Glycomyces buryatensis]